MESFAQIDIHADRWVACIRTLAFVGYDFTGATFKSQVRQTKDSGGTPLADLSTVTLSTAEGVRLIYGGTDTVANHITAGRLSEVPPGFTAASSIAVSQLGIRINEATMEAMPLGAEVGDDAEAAWDLHVTPSGGLKDKFAGGKFVIRAGVTQ